MKSIDPNHMIDTGSESQGATRYGYGSDSGTPLIYIHQSPYIDFVSGHAYPDESWANLTTTQAANLVAAWIADSNTVGKPFVLGEFNTYSNQEAYWSAIYNKMETLNGGGDNFWDFMLNPAVHLTWVSTTQLLLMFLNPMPIT